jgi:glycosyltransferase involved in cell wall biosynthesis
MEISVIIPVYNAAAFVKQAVTSALVHDEVNEIILIEDGSNDQSFQVCQELENRNSIIKLFHHKGNKNLGPGASRNLGIEKATKAFISFLDADDQFTDIRFEKDKEIFNSIQDCDAVYGATGVKYLDEKGAKNWESFGYDINSLDTVSKPIPPEKLFDFLTGIDNYNNYNGYFTIDAITFKREKLIKSNIRFNEELRLHQDTVFILQCANKLKMFTGEFQIPIAIRGVHGKNRFLFNDRMALTRSKMYRVLRDWSEESSTLSDNYTKFFNERFFINLISGQRRLCRIPKFYKYYLIDRLFRKHTSFNHFKYVLKNTFF